ncbi:hypothetical protein DPMN_183868 [Dreissena polymorpha]|uniref:Uncharacterized protein n=1 Tax=Dreissena polymorpha TaxID=45954 RepID=A0A9D4DID9_DREPO|nr:hypothetical protein DPMN_183868 [Dreissena polymorpha]
MLEDINGLPAQPASQPASSQAASQPARIRQSNNQFFPSENLWKDNPETSLEREWELNPENSLNSLEWEVNIENSLEWKVNLENLLECEVNSDNSIEMEVNPENSLEWKVNPENSLEWKWEINPEEVQDGHNIDQTNILLLNNFDKECLRNVNARVFTTKCGRTDSGRTYNGQRPLPKAHLSNQTSLEREWELNPENSLEWEVNPENSLEWKVNLENLLEFYEDLAINGASRICLRTQKCLTDRRKDGRTDNAKTISLRLWRGIINDKMQSQKLSMRILYSCLSLFKKSRSKIIHEWAMLCKQEV